MKAEERIKQIGDAIHEFYLREGEVALVKDLAKEVGCSEATIRKHIDKVYEASDISMEQKAIPVHEKSYGFYVRDMLVWGYRPSIRALRKEVLSLRKSLTAPVAAE